MHPPVEFDDVRCDTAGMFYSKVNFDRQALTIHI
jgi:hypothetical protein